LYRRIGFDAVTRILVYNSLYINSEGLGGVPLRRTILYLAAHKSLRNWMETSPAARRLSRRFVAGSSLKDALSVVRRLHEEGITATLDYLART